MNTTHISEKLLRNWSRLALEALDVSETDAHLVADSLVQTSLWGVDTHGIARLPHYLRRLEAGSTEAQPTFNLEVTGPGTASLDGGHGLGIVVSDYAMGEAMRLAGDAGVGVVGCHHSTHCGALGLYGRKAARAGLVGIAFAHADDIVAPHGGRQAFFGTNPICIAVPNAEGEPVCVDMATSVIPLNQVMNARRDGVRLPPYTVVNQAGQPTTDANAAAALLPASAHKGYALAFLIDALCGPLNGMPYGPHIPKMYGDIVERRNLGALMIALDPQRFVGGAQLAATVAAMVQEVRTQPPAEDEDEVLAPSDPEYRNARERAIHGIPLETGLIRELVQWAERLGLEAPF